MKHAAPLMLIVAATTALAACGQESVNPPTEPARPADGAPSAPPAPEPGVTPTLPGTGPASFVGRWAANVAWCATPNGAERPIEITPTRFEGYENSCAIERVDQTATGYDAALVCQSEGMTNRERVRMAVAGQTLNLTYLDRDGARVQLTKCTTLGETPERSPEP